VVELHFATAKWDDLFLYTTATSSRPVMLRSVQVRLRQEIQTAKKEDVSPK